MTEKTRTRSRTLTVRAIDDKSRTVDLAFSSDRPIDRGLFFEVLSHDRAAVRLDRLNARAPLLLNHNTDDQIGVVESARIDSDALGRAKVRFSKSKRAQEIFRDVVDGVRSLVSVGFAIFDEVLEPGKRGQSDTIRVLDWMPLEISIVPIPADLAVGVGRSYGETAAMEHFEDLGTIASEEDRLTRAQRRTERGNDDAEHRAYRVRERTNKTIRSIGRQYGVPVETIDEAIDLDASVEDFQQTVRALRVNIHKPVIQAPAYSPGAPFQAERIEHVGSAQDYLHQGGELRDRVKRAFGPTRQIAEERMHVSGQWVRAALLGDRNAERWLTEGGHIRAMSEGVFTGGGALVPEQLSSAIVDLREEYGIARQLCRTVSMNSDMLSIPRRTGSVTASWTGEGAALTASDASFDDIGLVAKKLTALTLVSTELAEDSVIDMAAFLADDMSMKFAQSEDEAYIDGDGTSSYGGLVGLRPKIINGDHTASAIDAASTIDTLPAITGADLDTLISKLPVYALKNAQWLISPAGNALVFQSLASAAGGASMMELGSTIVQSYSGYKINVSPVMPNDSTADYSNLAMLFFGDFSRASTLADRRGFRVQILTELYSANDRIGIQSTERVDIVNHDLGDTSAAGPVVALIGE